MRPLFLCSLFISISVGASSLSAQTTPASDGDLKRDVAALRDAVIQQTRQIDALTTEIERLGVAMGQRRGAKTGSTADATPAPIATPVPVTAPAAPVTAPAAPVTAAAAPATATAAPADPNLVQHTVSKGENLTIISKKYGVTIEAIQKLNKITDVRKMQVGQVLSIPAASPSPAATSTPSNSPTP